MVRSDAAYDVVVDFAVEVERYPGTLLSICGHMPQPRVTVEQVHNNSNTHPQDVSHRVYVDTTSVDVIKNEVSVLINTQPCIFHHGLR